MRTRPSRALPASALSVVVPVWRTPLELLEQALASVSGQGAELVVVDDGWGEVPAALARRHGAELVRLPDNRGPGPARNAGVEAASGDQLFFLDADDVLEPGSLAALTRALVGEPALLYTDRAWVNPAGETVHVRDHSVWPPLIERHRGGAFDPLLHTTILQGHQACARQAFMDAGGFRAELGCEHELMLRLAAGGGPVLYAPGALYRYRERPGSVRSERFGEVVATVARHIAGAARERGLDVVAARRLGRLAPTFVPVYELLRADGSRLEAPWIEYGPLRLAASA